MQKKTMTKDEILKQKHRTLDRAALAELRLPNAVYELRRSINVSQDKFASILGMTRQHIADIESGRANPTMETLNKIGKVFGLQVGFIPVQNNHDKIDPMFVHPNLRFSHED